MTRRSILLPAIVFAAAAAGQASNYGPFSCTTCGGGSGYQIGSQMSTVPNPYTDNYTMIVKGSISKNSFTMGAGSSSQAVWIGGTYGGFNRPQPTISQLQAANYFDFSAARTSLDNLSTTIVSNGTNIGAGLLVYNVDASYFTNTTGGVPVRFNLPEGTTLSTSDGSINGSILAANAAFSSNQTIDGELFVASVTSLAETHDQYYNGVLPSLASVATPEPASFLLFGGALIAIGRIGRNGRTKNQ